MGMLIAHSQFFNITGERGGVERYIVPDLYEVYYQGKRIVRAEINTSGDPINTSGGPLYWVETEGGEAIQIDPDATVMRFSVISRQTVDLSKLELAPI